MRRLAATFGLLVLALLFSAPLKSAAKATPEALPSRDFKVTDQYGTTWDSTDFKGLVLVDFWASWCKPCLKNIPQLNAFTKEMEGKVRVLGLCVDTKPDDFVQMTAKKFDIQYPWARTDPRICLAYAVTGFPTMLLFKDGKVVKYLTGNHSSASLKRELKEFRD